MKKVLVCLLSVICLFSTTTYGIAVSPTTFPTATTTMLTTTTGDGEMGIVDNNIKIRIVAVIAVSVLVGSFALGYKRKKDRNDSRN